MLTHVTIDNIVLIDHLSLAMDKGLTALTGETGAGKSILLDSLGLALGYRADAGLLRKGAESGSVVVAFDLPHTHDVFSVLKEHDLPTDEGLIIRRTINKDGRSKAFINDRPVTLSLLKDIGKKLVDIHSQFETHGLLDSKNHADLLDNFAKLQNDVQVTKKAWMEWRSAIKSLEEHEDKLQKAKENEEYLIACIEELQKIAPEKGEEDILLEKRQRLQHYEAVITGLNDAFQALENDKGANDSLYRAVRSLEKIASFAEDKIDPFIQRLDENLSSLRDIAGDLEMMAHGWGEDENIDYVDDRLHEIRALARKHNILCDDLPDLLENMQDDLTSIHNDDRMSDILKQAVHKAEEHYFKRAHALSEKRHAAALILAQKVMTELPDLKLGNAVFRVRIETTQTPRDYGLDDICFVIRTNAGSPEGELGKIASGGELSRIMLALKVVLAQSTPVPVMVFDEVDSGIGGSTADAVGARLARMAQEAQILVVTHSPQVAAKSDHHWIIAKSDGDGGTTTTSVMPITDETARIDEIARMVSGASLTDEARAAAKVLRDAA